MLENQKERQISINLKSATMADLPILLQLEQSVAGTNIYSPMLEESEWKEELQKNHVHLIQGNKQIVGSISYEIKNSDHIYISGLVINPEFQGKGFGKKALLSLLEKFKDVSRIDLVTHPDNTKAVNLYKSLGFVEESRQENYYGDDEPRLVLTLEKNKFNMI